MTALADHLWQSSLFALAAGLLTLALRRNAARIRFWLWFAASLKFLVPFAALVFLGERLARLMPAPLPPSLRALVPMAQKFSAPAQALAPAHGADFTLPLLLIWLAGFCAILGLALTRWLKLRIVIRQAHVLPFSGAGRNKGHGFAAGTRIGGNFQTGGIAAAGSAGQSHPRRTRRHSDP